MAGMSNVQLEILKLFGNDVSEESLKEVKGILAKHFAQRASDEMDAVCETDNLTEQTMIDWSNEHNRAENRPRH
jgi:hypothetical protein